MTPIKDTAISGKITAKSYQRKSGTFSSHMVIFGPEPAKGKIMLTLKDDESVGKGNQIDLEFELEALLCMQGQLMKHIIERYRDMECQATAAKATVEEYRAALTTVCEAAVSLRDLTNVPEDQLPSLLKGECDAWDLEYNALEQARADDD